MGFFTKRAAQRVLAPVPIQIGGWPDELSAQFPFLSRRQLQSFGGVSALLRLPSLRCD